MKRTATTLVLLAGLGGGGCTAANQQTARAPQQQQVGGFGTVTRGKQIDNLQGAMGEPVMAVRGAAPSGVRPAGGNTLVGSVGVRPAGGANNAVMADGATGAYVPGVGGNVIRQTNYVSGVKEALGSLGQPVGGPPSHLPSHGIVPVPTMGAPGAVAYVGPFAGAAARGGQFTGRSSINFTGPAGMKVTWQMPDGTFNDEANALVAPKPYNFLQGQVYRLRLGSILPDFPGQSFYPTLEVAPANPKSLTFLSHSSVPVTFAADDFAQAAAGNLVVKVIYLPDPINQDFRTVIGAEEVVSTRLEPGADPVAEAQRRGTILAVIRMGNIDLENKVSPAMTAPPPGLVPPGFGGPPPGLIPPGGGGPVPVSPGAGSPPPPKSEATPPKKVEIVPSKTGTEPKPESIGVGVALPLAPAAPMAPTNPPGTASVKPVAPAALPALPLPPSAPTDLPPAPVAPVAPPKAK